MHRTRGTGWVTLALVLVTLAATPVAAQDPAPKLAPDVPAIVRCEPLAVVSNQETAVIDLYIEDTANMYGVDIYATFDPAIGTVVDYNPFMSGVQLQPLDDWFFLEFSLSNRACNTVGTGCTAAGTIWYAGNQLNPTPPANGSGAIARITFQRVTYGTFPIHFTYTQLGDINGIEIPSLRQDCSVTFVTPLAVQIASFSAERAGAGVRLAWETVSEVDNAGFNLYRARDENAERVRVNRQLIPAVAPGSSTGGVYAWQDARVFSRATYYYWLEAVDFNGVTELFGPLVVEGWGAEAPLPPPVVE